MNFKLGLLLLVSSTLILSSCAKSKDDEPAAPFTPDSERAIGEPRFSFQAEQQEIKLKALNAKEISEMLSCNEKSTSFRTKREKFAVGYGNVSRSVADGKQSVMSQKIDFMTENREEVYQLTTTIGEYHIAGNNVLDGGAISYRDLCSASSGCDQEKRQFLLGSSSNLISMKLKEEAIIEELGRQKRMTDCYLKSAVDDTEHVQKGQIRIGENTYKAIQYIKKETGKVYCRVGASRESLFLGEGVQIKKHVYVLDQLVMPSKVGHYTTSTSAMVSCARTVAFSSTEIQFEGNTIIGSSNELVDYSYSGETLSLEDWNKNQAKIRTQIGELKNDIIVKKANVDNAQLNVTESENKVRLADARVAELRQSLNEAIAQKREEEQIRTRLKDAEARVTELKQKLADAIAAKQGEEQARARLKEGEARVTEIKQKLADLVAAKKDEEQIRTQLKDAETVFESQRALRDSAKNLLVLAQNQHKDAEAALVAYLKENGTGEN